MKRTITNTILILLVTALLSTPFVYNYWLQSYTPLDSIVEEYNSDATEIINAKKIVPRILIDIKAAKSLNLKEIPYRLYFDGLEGRERMSTMDYVDNELYRLGYSVNGCKNSNTMINLYPKFYNYGSFWISSIFLCFFLMIVIGYFPTFIEDFDKDLRDLKYPDSRRNKSNFIINFLKKLGSK